MAEKELLNAISEMMDEKLSGIKEDVRELKEDVGILKEEVSELKEDVGILKEEVSELKEDVGILKEEVSELKEDFEILKEDVEILKEDVGILKGEVCELKGDVSALKEDNVNIWKELSGMKGQLTDLQSVQVETNAKLDLMEAEVRGMRTHLENVTDLKIKLIAENIFPATSKYIASTKEIVKLREGFDVLNQVVRNHSERIRKAEERFQMA